MKTRLIHVGDRLLGVVRDDVVQPAGGKVVPEVPTVEVDRVLLWEGFIYLCGGWGVDECV